MSKFLFEFEEGKEVVVDRGLDGITIGRMVKDAGPLVQVEYKRWTGNRHSEVLRREFFNKLDGEMNWQDWRKLPRAVKPVAGSLSTMSVEDAAVIIRADDRRKAIKALRKSISAVVSYDDDKTIAVAKFLGIEVPDYV